MATKNVKLILKLGVKCMTPLNSARTGLPENVLPFYSNCGWFNQIYAFFLSHTLNIGFRFNMYKNLRPYAY